MLDRNSPTLPIAAAALLVPAAPAPAMPAAPMLPAPIAPAPSLSYFNLYNKVGDSYPNAALFYLARVSLIVVVAALIAYRRTI